MVPEGVEELVDRDAVGAGCPAVRLDAFPSRFHVGFEMTGTKHRGLTPHKITPMLGVHGRGAAESTLLKWMIVCGGPVIATVRWMSSGSLVLD